MNCAIVVHADQVFSGNLVGLTLQFPWNVRPSQEVIEGLALDSLHIRVEIVVVTGHGV